MIQHYIPVVALHDPHLVYYNHFAMRQVRAITHMQQWHHCDPT